MISVIIPTFKAEKYIESCIQSILSQDDDCEILIGIDDCKSTLDYVLKSRYKNIKIFYFENNVGPYVIKNTLSDIASCDKLLFFDSDDVMVEGCLYDISSILDNSDYIRLNYINFNGVINTKDLVRNDAVMGIKRNIFNTLNGFQPWRCAADAELYGRISHNHLICGNSALVHYYRRIHGENITLNKDTGFGSEIRNNYIKSINKLKKDGWPNPLTKTTEKYVDYTIA